MAQVKIEEISFNHSPGTGSPSVNLQRNGQFIAAPEWRFGMTKPEDSAAAYTIKNSTQSFVLKVRLSSLDPSLKQACIRATAGSGSVLGDVQKFDVIFDNQGKSQIIPVVVNNSKFSQTGTTAGTSSWSWEIYNSATGSWKGFALTQHRIYVTFDEPKEPWGQEPVWTEVLDEACKWAAGAKNPDEVSTKITQYLFSLGENPKHLILYNESGNYAEANFDCAKFLRLLKGDASSPPNLDCTDCAAIVSTFANALGCELWQSEMGPLFATRYVKFVGSSNWSTHSFPCHVVAWKGDCEAKDPVFDACLQIDGDDHPEDHSHFTPLLATNLSFGGYLNYQYRLVASGTCDPDPDSRERRPLGQVFRGQRQRFSSLLLTRLKEHYHFDDWPSPGLTDDGQSFTEWLDQIAKLPAFADWKIVEKQDFDIPGLLVGTRLLWTHLGDAGQMVELNFYEVQRPARNEFVLKLLAAFHPYYVEREDTETIDSLVFITSSEIIAAQGKFVADLRSVGKKAVPIIDMAKAIEDLLEQSTD